MTKPTAWDEARRMLNASGIAQQVNDWLILGRDIIEVLHEDDTVELYATDAARELERRIGGLANLESYMACLRVGAK